MLTGDVADTFMNLMTFAFIGAMAWLLVREPLGDRRNDRDAR